VEPGHTLDAVLLESAPRWQEQHTMFGRWESAEDELFRLDIRTKASVTWFCQYAPSYPQS
jgi:hypothetical protein